MEGATVRAKRLSLKVAAVILVVVVLLIYIFPKTTPEQYFVLRILVSIGAGGIAGVVLNGFVTLKYKGVITAGGTTAFALIIYFSNPAQLPKESFSFSVYLHGKNSRQDIVLKEGKVIADIGNDRRFEEIDDRGGAYFKGIPSSFKNKKIEIDLDAATYGLKGNKVHEIYDNAAIYIEVIRIKLDKLNGIILDNLLQPVYGASIQIDNLIYTSDSSGRFSIHIPENNQERVKKVIISKTGYKTWIGNVAPETNEQVQIKLSRL